MKIVKTFRVDKDFSEKITTLAESQGITFSQFVELSCYAMADEQPKPTKQIEKHKKVEIIDVSFMVDQPTFKKLTKIVQSKNSTLSQEINYRLSASLDSPIFSDVEFGKMWAIKCDIDRLGNLFKLAIDQETPVDNDLFNQIENNINKLREEFRNTLMAVSERKLK